MKVIFTGEALLDRILAFIATNYPTKSVAFEKRLRTVVMRISAWPESAAEDAERPGVRVVPLIRYPYKVFYRVTSDAVEVLLYPPCGAAGAVGRGTVRASGRTHDH